MDSYSRKSNGRSRSSWDRTSIVRDLNVMVLPTELLVNGIQVWLNDSWLQTYCMIILVRNRQLRIIGTVANFESNQSSNLPSPCTKPTRKPIEWWNGRSLWKATSSTFHDRRLGDAVYGSNPSYVASAHNVVPTHWMISPTYICFLVVT